MNEFDCLPTLSFGDRRLCAGLALTLEVGGAWGYRGRAPDVAAYGGVAGGVGAIRSVCARQLGFGHAQAFPAHAKQKVGPYGPSCSSDERCCCRQLVQIRMRGFAPSW